MTGIRSLAQIPDRVRARFWGNVDRRSDRECWPWLLSTGSHGYGQAGWWEAGHSRMMLAHRLAWILTHGDIPAGLTIDHDDGCDRRCCNPRHLSLMTNVENATRNRQAMRGRGRRSYKAAI